MWKVDYQDWSRLKRIVGDDYPENKRKKLKKLIDKGELTRDDIDQIYDLLPPDSKFYEFSNQLRLKSRTIEQFTPKPEFIELTQRLQTEQDKRDYNKMVASVDSTQNYGNVNYMQDFGKEMKEANRQLLSIFNTLLTVAAAFAFGFYGISIAYPSLNLGLEVRLIFGICAATVVFFADLYFIVKHMDTPSKPEPIENEQKEIQSTSDQHLKTKSRRRIAKID